MKINYECGCDNVRMDVWYSDDHETKHMTFTCDHGPTHQRYRRAIEGGWMIDNQTDETDKDTP